MISLVPTVPVPVIEVVRLMEVIPRSVRLESSPASVTPLPFTSRQTFKSEKFVSVASTMPSRLVSYVASSVKPLVVAEPNISVISSISPLALLSTTRNPSLPFTHPVRSAKPSPSISKSGDTLVWPRSSMPSPSRSSTSGSLSPCHGTPFTTCEIRSSASSIPSYMACMPGKLSSFSR